MSTCIKAAVIKCLFIQIPICTRLPESLREYTVVNSVSDCFFLLLKLYDVIDNLNPVKSGTRFWFSQKLLFVRGRQRKGV